MGRSVPWHREFLSSSLIPYSLDKFRPMISSMLISILAILLVTLVGFDGVKTKVYKIVKNEEAR